jgi:hypothetical protein
MNAMILLTALSAGQPPAALPAIPTPGAAQPAPMPMVPPAGMPPANGNGEKKEEEPKEEEKKDEPEPYALMRILSATRFGAKMEERGVTVSGWVQGNYTLSTSNRSNLPTTFNDRKDFWQMNQNFLRIDKAIDTEKEEFQLGYRTELILPGTDARFTLSRGLLDQQLRNGQNGMSKKYPIDLFQAYAEAYMPNLGPNGTSVKVGKFATLVGYELVQGAETPFLSRSYVFQYNPFTHTGVLATSKLNDTWTASYGAALGSDNFIDSTNRFTYLGQLKWAPEESKTNVLLNIVLTNPRFDVPENFAHYNVYNAVLTHNFSDKLTYVADATFSHINGTAAGGSATWYGAAQYLIYKHCDKVTSTARVELFEDTKGFRTGSPGLYTAVTYGLALQPHRSVLFRPTVRYDHNNTSRPFDGSPNLFSAAFDVILRY